MKKRYLICSLALLLTSAMTAQAQTILEEDFETGATAPAKTPLTRGEGWTTIDSYKGEKMTFNWYNEYRDPTSQSGPIISGANCAACDAPINVNPVDGSGPREEILLSPELNLDDTYQLQFSWEVSTMYKDEKSLYDLQVRVVVDNDLQGAETVFSLHNENQLRESGVNPSSIMGWSPYTSKVDLSDWRGEKVKLAFVYKLYTQSANVVYLDDITVKKFTPATGPVASINMDRYNFGSMYLGEKVYSEVFTLTNTGKNGLTITGMDLPQGISTTLDAESVNLRTYEKVNFQLAYTAAMTTPAKSDVIIHTTGGDVKIEYTVTKEVLPDGYTLEGFNQYFPPAGWIAKGWSAASAAIEGDQSAYCGGDFSASYLRSPRLDLSDGGKVTFTYYNQYDGESAPEYDITLEVSYDGGTTWEKKWTSDYQNGLNQLLTQEVDLGEGTGNDYIRWYYPAIESDDEGAYDHSSFTLDRVLLPNVFGANGVPGPCTYLTPENNAKEVYPKNIVLSWGPAQFAKGYKVYVGSNTEANNLVDGANVLNNLSFTIPQADYETTYRWKVVAYNDNGAATDVSIRKFTTQKDATVMEFPYTENFDECNDKTMPVPTGWLSTTTSSYTFPLWSPNSYYPYGGKGVSLAAGHLEAGQNSTLVSPEFNLPADGKGMSISFVWGNAHPSDLVVDETGLLKKENVTGGNGKDEVRFEIFADGEWKLASYLSESYATDKKYWRNEKIDLMEYAGKKVQFRWVCNCFETYKGYATLDNIVIDGNVDDFATFNKTGWDAGKINFKKAVNSGDQFTMMNKGKNALKIKSVTFGTENFQSSLAVGTEIAVDEGVTFNVQFNAGESAKVVKDEMTVEFESGSKATFPVQGEGLPFDVLYYGFEKNPLDYDWKTDFTTIDVDHKSTHELGYYQTVLEDDGARYAFTQALHYNSNMLAHSGVGTLAAAAPDDQSAANDWLITKMIRPLEGAAFDFYARNLSTTGSVFVGDNDLHCVEVLVSETGNTNTSDFKTVMYTKEMSYLDENQWHHFNIDLSAYAGKNIYVAVRHTTNSASFVAFFDDFTFNHVGDPDLTGIENVKANLDEDTQVTVYTLNGVQVASGRCASVMQNLNKGMYVVKANGKTVKAIRK